MGGSERIASIPNFLTFVEEPVPGSSAVSPLGGLKIHGALERQLDTVSWCTARARVRRSSSNLFR